MKASATVSIPNLSKSIRRVGAAEIERRANRYGQQMADLVVSILNSNYNTGRDAGRRRSPNSQRIVDGWSYKVEGDPGSFPIFLTLTSDGDADYQKRIRYLNDGTPGHTIRARQRQTKSGQAPRLRFPADSDGSIAGPPWAFPKSVEHPGTTGTHFIEAAMEGVMVRIAARAI